MPSPYHGNRLPFTLPSNIVYFHDWRYVDTGSFAWMTADGKHPSMWSLDPVPPMHLEYRRMPLGIRLVAQRARKSDVVLTPEGADELFLFGGTLINEEGRYRLWYDCWPREHMASRHMGLYNYVRYAESDDSVHWRLPSLGLIERNGTRSNNICYGGPLTQQSGYHGGCVFVDPSAPAAERYKAFHLGVISAEGIEAFRKRRPDAVDPFSSDSALYGAVSPDGLHWTPINEPLVVQTSDTHNVCTYDPVTRKYVAYCRSWFFHRRTIGRMETDDFRCFPLPEELFWPNAMMAPHELWYANGKTIMPNTIDYHVMFPMRWSLPEDAFDFHLATSPDGVVWGFVPGGPVCQRGEPGAWDQGLAAPGLGMVDLPGERMGILYAGSAVPHKHPRHPPLGGLGWAWWPKGRLVALEAELEGSFSLWPLRFCGRTARLNFRTWVPGFVQVEACGPDDAVLPGRSFEDCDPLNGDRLDQVITWRGQSDLGHPEGTAVRLSFRLRGAQIFAVAFQ